MNCRKAFIVQSTDDYSFLKCDGEGGVVNTFLITHATPFDTAEAAREAIQDHCDERGVIYPIWMPS